MYRSKAAVVVLPLVPVITTVPSRSARDSFVRMAGSTQRETSPGSVVPPPRRNPRLKPAVSLPAHSAAMARAFIFDFPPPVVGEGQGGGCGFPPPLAGEGRGGGRRRDDRATR